jgi:hypothetical protein
MAFKKIYNKINCFNVFEKKLNGLVLYNKQYIRNKLMLNINLTKKKNYINKKKKNYLSILDNNSFLFYGVVNKPVLSGCDFFGENTVFSHRNLLSISFIAIYTFRLPNLKNISIKLISLMKLTFKKYAYKLPLLILCPVKGGFKSYYLGIFGFIPFRHGLLGVKRFVFKIFKYKSLISLNSISSLSKILHFFSVNNTFLFFNLYKFFFQISSIKLNYRFKYRFKYKGRLKYKYKSKIIKRRLNFVFITENKNLYKNSYKKIYKKIYRKPLV